MKWSKRFDEGSILTFCEIAVFFIYVKLNILVLLLDVNECKYLATRKKIPQSLKNF